MNTEFFEALALLEKEKGIPADYLLEKIKAAIAIAVKRDYGGSENGQVEIDPEKGKFSVAIRKTVVEAVENPNTEILLEDAYKYDKKVQTGSTVDIPLETKQFGRIAAQAAKHVIRQGIREAERGQMMQEFQSREHEIISAKVVRTDPARGSATLEIGKSEAMLTRQEQVPGEELHEGDHVKVYVVEVAPTDRGPRVMLSRTHPGLVKRLFEMEVPELYDGTVELKAISREAGSRTKIAVYSKDPNVDAVGACIGPKGARVAKIVDELNGEKIDVVKYSEDPGEFVAAALSPSQVVSVEVAEDGSKNCTVKVPDNQLSLAIGNKGQNARLAAKLTGWKIDIKPESGFYGEE
jgi:N utilization substance protein A